MKRMEQAARAPGGENSPEAARLQKQIEQAQKQLGTPTGTPEDMDKMKKQTGKNPGSGQGGELTRTAG